MSGPNFTGPAIFAGIGQGVEKATDNYIKLLHMHNEARRQKSMDNYMKYRLATQATNGLMQRGIHKGPINDDEEEATSARPGVMPMQFDPELVEQQNPTRPSSGGVSQLGGGTTEDLA